MKKEYTTPLCRMVPLRPHILNNSSPGNEYYDNQGKIRFRQREINAEDAD